MRFAIAVLASLTIGGGLSAPARAQAPERLDVLFIAVDDLNDWVGVLGGNPQTKTPNIDALAARGMLFTNANTVATACLPSRTALLTGVSPFTSGIYEQRGDWRTEPGLRNLPTLPRYFRDNGYRTFGAGKIFHAHTYGGPEGFEGQQDVTAWDAFYPSIGRQLPDEMRPPRSLPRGAGEYAEPRSAGRQWGNFDWRPIVTEDFATGDGQDVAWIEQQLNTPSAGSRFVAVGIYRPHLPWYVPQKYFDMHPLESIELPDVPEDDLADVPSSALNHMRANETHQWVLEHEGVWQQAVQGYLASVSFADAMVGRVLDALEKSGRADHTIIVLWGDHGFHLGEKERWRKMTLWEESARVPLIIVAPGVTRPGTRTNQAVSLLDVYPTLTELAGLAPPEQLEGRSLAPLLREPDRDWDEVPVTVYGYGNYSVRDDRYRYIVYSDGAEELYDHATDPNEWTNLAADSELAAVKARLAAAIPEQRARPVGTRAVEAGN